jgi:hypothetical protein
LFRPRAQQGVLNPGARGEGKTLRLIVEPTCARHALLVEPVADDEAHHGPHPQRLADQVSPPEPGRAGHRIVTVPHRILGAATVEEGVAQHHDHLYAGGLIIAALVDRALEEPGGLQEAVVVKPHGRE